MVTSVQTDVFPTVMSKKTSLLWLPLLLALGACATTTSPTGRTQMVGGVSQQQLEQMGQQAFNEMRSKKPLASDARAREYVGCVVRSIVRELPAQWQRQGWESALFQDDAANALVLPGGKVVVYTGIFKAARNQDQLAAVVAHEVGHVIAHHHNERITRQLGTEQIVAILGAMAGARYGSGAAQTVGQLGGMTAQGAFLLPGSRQQEIEADVIGQELMARAGFDPREAAHFWQNMMQVSGSRGPEWLSTHPDPRTRLAEMNQRAATLMTQYQQARQSGRQPACQ